MQPAMDQVEAVRRFNRFYTRTIGVLPEGHLNSPYSLVEVRVLYELAHRDGTTATDLIDELALDAGYLSRILRRFEERALITRRRSKEDGRQTLLALTRKGRSTFAVLNDRARDGVRAILRPLSRDEERRLEQAMRTIEVLLGHQARAAPFTLRSFQAGDLGWVVQRHGALYAEEYGRDQRFEALVARIVADFVDHFDPKKERCWIAEQNGENVGCVFLVRKSSTAARLRCLLVEPRARGAGIGARLVDECTRFARKAGYRKIMLWTNSVLTDARRLYQRAGYRLVAQERHHSFGHDLVGETWELNLRPRPD
jgi:DNA-binding MarR family transcriptional regulator/N-acetylglutamate synthase-like GNAT family acetyltransferase